MAPNLATTNALLGIMAAVSVIEVLAVLACVFGILLIYRRVLRVVGEVEDRQVAPAAARVNAILDDVKNVTTAVKEDAACVDGAIRSIVRTLRRAHVVLLLAGPLLARHW